MKTCYFDVLYDEFNVLSYEGISYSIYEKENDSPNEIINSGDIVVDYIDLCIKSSEESVDVMLHSSSWDNFFIDSPYHHFIYDEENECELPAPETVGTFAELQEYYKKVKKIQNKFVP